MFSIRISKRELDVRGNDVRKLLVPISSSSQRGGPAWSQSTSGSFAFVIGTHDGSPAGSDYRGWTFATIHSKVRAQYFERWLKAEERGREFWYLEKAYLHMSRVDRNAGQLVEFLCLHCDPNDAPDEELKTKDRKKYDRLSKQSFYKQHPHLHVISADIPFPKAHLALHLGYKHQVLKSVGALSVAMRHVVQMIRDEVLDAMEPS